LMSVQAISDFFALGLNNWRPSGVELPLNPVFEIAVTNPVIVPFEEPEVKAEVKPDVVPTEEVPF